MGSPTEKKAFHIPSFVVFASSIIRERTEGGAYGKMDLDRLPMPGM